MTVTDTRSEADDLGAHAALGSVTAAGIDLAFAKRTKSRAVIESAQHRLQSAVDAARGVGVEWGPIGAALGIARGNAYQRFRRKPCRTALGDCRYPAGNAPRGGRPSPLPTTDIS